MASFGQLEVHHSSIGNAAIKSGFSGQVLVSHSSGQSGVNGTRSTDQFLVFEGFQQPMTSQVRKTESLLMVDAWPNPFQDILTIQVEGVETSSIQISAYDMTGRQLYQETSTAATQNQINLSQLPAGSYLITITDQVNSVSLQVIKQ